IHGYPMSVSDLERYAGQTNSAGKNFFVGEFGWTNIDKDGSPTGDPLADYLAAIEANAGISGDLYWDLYPHANDHGYVGHEDESSVDAFTLHYPGTTPDMRTRAQA